ncbi:hypothetical protein cyc_08118 [Cyclospora cayetanensis]|uniref:LsmAD domain-containing protein n=1 Tax=Cyclospora cayetanensis TaxID=88456 RepID=A0A1D3D4R6_9EIME|nr:hypothetical protein cyc_08118 [Cyclospora cayetanensis]
MGRSDQHPQGGGGSSRAAAGGRRSPFVTAGSCQGGNGGSEGRFSCPPTNAQGGAREGGVRSRNQSAQSPQRPLGERRGFGDKKDGGFAERREGDGGSNVGGGDRPSVFRRESQHQHQQTGGRQMNAWGRVGGEFRRHHGGGGAPQGSSGGASEGSASVFQTDAQIAAAKAEAGGGGCSGLRPLVRWNGGDADAPLQTLEEAAGCGPAGAPAWDQFKDNRERFGVCSTYKEELYTTPLDKSSVPLHLRAKANRLAKEMEAEAGLRHKDSLLEADGEDEEALFSAVRNTGAYARRHVWLRFKKKAAEGSSPAKCGDRKQQEKMQLINSSKQIQQILDGRKVGVGLPPAALAESEGRDATRDSAGTSSAATAGRAPPPPQSLAGGGAPALHVPPPPLGVYGSAGSAGGAAPQAYRGPSTPGGLLGDPSEAALVVDSTALALGGTFGPAEGPPFAHAGYPMGMPPYTVLPPGTVQHQPGPPPHHLRPVLQQGGGAPVGQQGAPGGCPRHMGPLKLSPFASPYEQVCEAFTVVGGGSVASAAALLLRKEARVQKGKGRAGTPLHGPTLWSFLNSIAGALTEHAPPEVSGPDWEPLGEQSYTEIWSDAPSGSPYAVPSMEGMGSLAPPFPRRLSSHPSLLPSKI